MDSSNTQREERDQSSGTCAVCGGLFRLNGSGCLRVHGPVSRRCRGSGDMPLLPQHQLSGTPRHSGSSPRVEKAIAIMPVSSSSVAGGSGLLVYRNGDPVYRPLDLLQCVWSSPTNTIKRIPWNLRRRTADVFASLLLRAVSSNALRDWERFLSFPKLCLQPLQTGCRSGFNAHSRIKSLLDRFDKGRESECLPDSTFRTPREKSQSDKSIFAEAIELTRSGNYGKAMRRLTSSSIADYSLATRERLIELHPMPVDPFAMSPSGLTAPLSVDSDIVMAAVASFPPASSPGCLGLRAEHLRDMLSIDHGVLRHRLTLLVNQMIAGLLPIELSRFVAGGSLLALEKPDSGIRPIAIGETLRRLCAKCVCSKLRSGFADSLSPLQLGVATPNGMEQIIHQARRLHSIHLGDADWVWTKIDLTNAFNSLYRAAFINAIKKEFPEILGWVDWCYGSCSDLRFGNMDPILSARGVQQGDPLGPFLFCLALKPIISAVSAISGIGFNRWYLDDGIVAGSPEAVTEALSYLSSSFPTIGLEINWKKTELIGEAIGLDLVRQSCPLITLVNTTSNFTILGTPIGSQDFVSNFLHSTVLPKLRKQLDSLGTLPDPQVAFILLRECASASRVNHLMRTVDPGVASEFFRLFDSLVRDCFGKITSIQPDECSWLQACLPLKMGGLGLRSCSQHASAAFLSSVASVADMLDLNRHSFPGYVTAESNFPRHDQNLQFGQGFLSKHIDEISRSQLLEKADRLNSARLLAVACPHACAWLQAVPSKATSMNLAPDEFIALIRVWLGAPISGADYRCRRCLRPADKFGFHALTCQFGGFPGIRHDSLRDTIFQAASSAGLRVAREVPNLVRDLKERPADILIYEDPPLAVDFAVTNPQQKSFVAMASHIPGYAASKYAECVKDRKYKRKVEEGGYRFTAAVIETFGGWNNPGEKLIRYIARCMSWRNNVPYYRAVGHLFQRASVALMRGNAKAILKSLDDLGQPLLEKNVGLCHDPVPRFDSSACSEQPEVDHTACVLVSAALTGGNGEATLTPLDSVEPSPHLFRSASDSICRPLSPGIQVFENSRWSDRSMDGDSSEVHTTNLEICDGESCDGESVACGAYKILSDTAPAVSEPDVFFSMNGLPASQGINHQAVISFDNLNNTADSSSGGGAAEEQVEQQRTGDSVLHHMHYQPLSTILQASHVPVTPISPLATTLVTPQTPTAAAVEQPQLQLALAPSMDMEEDQQLFPIQADVVVPSVTTTTQEVVPPMSAGAVTTALRDTPITLLSQGLEALTVPSAFVDMTTLPGVSPFPTMAVDGAPSFPSGLTAVPSGLSGALTTSHFEATGYSFAQPMTFSAALLQQTSTVLATSATLVILRQASRVSGPVQFNAITTLDSDGATPNDRPKGEMHQVSGPVESDDDNEALSDSSVGIT